MMVGPLAKPHAYQFGPIDTNDCTRGADPTHSGTDILTNFDLFLLCRLQARQHNADMCAGYIPVVLYRLGM
jgi:hypothetical protein